MHNSDEKGEADGATDDPRPCPICRALPAHRRPEGVWFGSFGEMMRHWKRTHPHAEPLIALRVDNGAHAGERRAPDEEDVDRWLAAEEGRHGRS